MLPTSRPSIGEEELKEIKKVFDTGWLGLGTTVYEFESKIKEYLNAEHVIAVNTGTSALHLALDAIGITEKDEVIVPSLTFCASIQVITALKADPVFCEIDINTLNIDIEDVKQRITSKTKAIMPVHYCGNACDMDALLDIGRKRKIFIIEDAAHAFGSSYKDKKIGSFGDITCFSFDPIKNITCGEGGAVVLSDPDIAEKIRKKRILGIDKDTWHRYKEQRSWFYDVVTQGYRYHMSNFNAAIGLAQLAKLDSFIERKRNIVNRYNDLLSGLEGIELLKWDLDRVAPFSYIVRILHNKRDGAISFLKEKGVGSGVHYKANHIQPYFQKYNKPLPVTEKVWNEILTLPLYYDMSDADIDLVIKSMTEFSKR
ncbi:MAG: DegT/DnrJ/EryC1/StrS family aminotransferase [Planctomycetes bacterium]|nr:DegT/DnrJ/EryC1/StrS family aminotransferase [Planctomycetota bacterium]